MPMIYGLADVLTYRLGKRPLIKNDKALYRLVCDRFTYWEKSD
jgi:hypothetical protein